MRRKRRIPTKTSLIYYSSIFSTGRNLLLRARNLLGELHFRVYCPLAPDQPRREVELQRPGSMNPSAVISGGKRTRKWLWASSITFLSIPQGLRCLTITSQLLDHLPQEMGSQRNLRLYGQIIHIVPHRREELDQVGSPALLWYS